MFLPLPMSFLEASDTSEDRVDSTGLRDKNVNWSSESSAQPRSSFSSGVWWSFDNFSFFFLIIHIFIQKDNELKSLDNLSCWWAEASLTTNPYQPSTSEANTLTLSLWLMIIMKQKTFWVMTFLKPITGSDSNGRQTEMSQRKLFLFTNKHLMATDHHQGHS